MVQTMDDKQVISHMKLYNNDMKEDYTSQYEKMDEVDNQNTTFTKTTPEQLMAISGS